jgi:di/tricarboxylate transporter
MVKKYLSNKENVKWLVLIAGLILSALLPVRGFFTADLKEFFIVVVFAVLSCGMGMMDNLMIGILIPLGFSIFNIAPATTIYGGWAGTTPMVTFGSLLLAVVLEETGLLQRISLFCITKAGGTYKGACFGVLFAALVCSFLTSCNVMFVFAALAYGVVRTLKLKPGLPAAGIMFAGMVGTVTAQNCIYYPAAMGILLSSASTETTTVTVSWLQSMINTFPALFLNIFLLWFMLKFVIPTPEIDAKEELIQQYKNLGAMNKNEKKAVIVIAGIIISLVLSQWTGMDTSWPFLIAPWLFFIPGLKTCEYSSLKKVNIGMVFLVAGFLSIGAVANYLGIGQMLSEFVMPMYANKPLLVVVLMTLVLGAVANFALTPFAMYTAFSSMLVQIFTSLGFGALGSLYILQFSGDILLFPYESLIYLVYMSFGVVSMKDFMKLYSIKTVITVIWVLVIMVPWWRLLGVL